MCENNKLRISDAFNSRFLRFPCRFEKKNCNEYLRILQLSPIKLSLITSDFLKIRIAISLNPKILRVF